MNKNLKEFFERFYPNRNPYYVMYTFSTKEV